MARPSGLGKGLGALIPAAASHTRGATGGLREVPVSVIRPNPYQPRERFDEESLGELADSIREVGLLQPVLVRPADDGYELIAGERRWRAARRAGLQTIPALVRETDDNSTLEQALVENLQREGLNPLEEAGAYQQLIEDFHLTHEQVAGRVGKSRTAISNTLRLLQLPPAIQRMVREHQLSMGHARALLGTPDRGFQEQLARRAAAEDLSVRAVEDAIRTRNEGRATTSDSSGGSGGTRLRAPGILELEELLADFLETRVHISMPRGGKGRLTIDFADLADLERVYRRMTEPKAGAG
ncbi:MAG: ParB/RepB/Spo0J family partition protein [Actinobacteria bacterium]|nr:MAG: ParB/RepB/Spo0J family partition protein [Actinomycetota bacterium]TML66821.1 MAG: ParB/RepB/Spo0J family partition protein [Actinomycetota bacterium]